MATEKSNCETRGSPKATIEVDYRSIDELIGKVEKLNDLLKRADELLDSLTDRRCSKE